jgi:hypothetical protein
VLGSDAVLTVDRFDQDSVEALLCGSKKRFYLGSNFRRFAEE